MARFAGTSNSPIPKIGYFSTMAPLVIKDHVLIGVSGDVTDVPGFLESRDPETGKLQWHWNTEPKPGEPGSETWPQGTDAIAHGGGMTWITGTYDPDLNLTYWGTGNPNPVLNGDGRKGDNLYTCSIVALDPDTGKLKWHFQPSPHDTHDWDAVQTPILFDDNYRGVQRKLLAQGSRNGYFFVLDRTTGEHVLTKPFIETNWSSGIDSHGQPRPKKEKEPKPDGTLVSPGSDGATNWMAPSYDPDYGMFYLSARRLWSVFYMTAEGKAEGWAGRDRNLWAESVLEGIDTKTGDVKWRHELGEGEDTAGILTTAGKLLFTADNSENLIILDPATGKTLWHTRVGGRMVASPMTYDAGWSAVHFDRGAGRDFRLVAAAVGRCGARLSVQRRTSVRRPKAPSAEADGCTLKRAPRQLESFTRRSRIAYNAIVAKISIGPSIGDSVWYLFGPLATT